MTESQLASRVLMIRPARFESNPLTATSNRFQGKTDASPEEQQAAALQEFDGLVDRLRSAGIDVVVVDDHITGVVSEHQAGKVLDWPDTGIRIMGHRSTPGRYFKVAQPGSGWGGTDIEDPLDIVVTALRNAD